MDAHLNLGKFLYEETPAWKKYHGDGGVVLVGLEQEPHRVQDWSELPVVRPLGVLGKQSDQDVIEECLEQLEDEVERLCNEEQYPFSYEIEPAIPSLQLKLTQRLLRAQKVAESLADRERQLSMEYSDLDTHLMLSYLLALPQVTAADQLFSKMAVSKVSLQLAIYYACLQIYARTAESSNGEPLLCPPATLMSLVISLCPPAY
eukprot:Em0009g382a